jgi:DNA-binding IclR family transcriptional regulator
VSITTNPTLTLGSDTEPMRRRSPLARALRVLDYLGGEPSTTAEIAGFLGVDRSTAHRLLGQLTEAEYIVRDPTTRRFAIAPGKLRYFGADETGAYVGGDWTEAISAVLSRLRDIAGEATMFAVPAGDRMLYAGFFPTGHPIGVQESIGSVRPMHASSVGKAYLSALSEETFDIVLGRLSFREGTDRAARGPVQLRQVIAETREQGYALDIDETFVGLSCVATPVLVDGRILVGAAGITGPTPRFTPDRIEFYAEFLTRHARCLLARG